MMSRWGRCHRQRDVHRRPSVQASVALQDFVSAANPTGENATSRTSKPTKAAWLAPDPPGAQADLGWGVGCPPRTPRAGVTT